MVAERDRPDALWGIFTGDSLFAGSAGRPDLLGDEQTEQLVEQLFRTLREFYLRLDDGVLLYPGHGAGSACGAAIGDRPMSTIGHERRHNPFLQLADLERFKRFVREGAPPEPHHYKRLKKVNAGGPRVLRGLPIVPPLPVGRFREAVERGDATLVDVRSMLAFGGGHIRGALNIGPRAELSVWAGQMLDPERPILLVAEDETDLDGLVALFLRTGFTEFAGYLVGGMKSWDNAGLPLETTPQLSVHELRRARDEVQILDVRAPEEWEGGHIPGARHRFIADMRDDGSLPDGFDAKRPIAVYCDSGYRASLVASLLQARGYRDVRNVPGSWQAWTKAGYPVEK